MNYSLLIRPTEMFSNLPLSNLHNFQSSYPSLTSNELHKKPNPFFKLWRKPLHLRSFEHALATELMPPRMDSPYIDEQYTS